MIWIAFFGNRISDRFITFYCFVTLCIIVSGAWLKLNQDPMANLFLMTGLGLTIDTLLMVFYKRITISRKSKIE